MQVTTTVHDGHIGRLLATISAISALKALVLLVIAVVPAWRSAITPGWGAPADAWLPLTVLSVVLFAASGEAARRRRAGAFWFVLAVNLGAVLTSLRHLDSVLGAGSFAASAALLVLVMLPPARNSLLRRKPGGS